MPRTYPQNPLARLINTRMAEVGISRVDLMKRLGYANPSRGLRRFDDFLTTGRITTHLLKNLPEVLGMDAAEVEAEAATTRQQIANAEETAARERFRPYILVLTELPPGIRFPAFAQMFAWGQKVVGLPGEFDQLSSSQQVKQAARIVRHHFGENGGELCAVWGTITGYRLQRTYDHAVILNTDGTIQEGFDRTREPPAPGILIGGKKVPMGMFGEG